MRSRPWSWSAAPLPPALALARGGSGGDRRLVLAARGDLFHGRLQLWDAALAAWRDQPWLGAGADGFLGASAAYQDAGPVRFAHDLPLELLVELGLAGGVLAIALYAATGRVLWQARGDRAVWLLGPAAAAFLVAGLVDWPWHLAGSGAVWAAAVGGLLGRRAATATREPPRGLLSSWRE